MRLVLLYYSNGSAAPGQKVKWGPKQATSNKFALGFPTEGLFYLFTRLLEEKVIDECLVVTESTRSPGRIDYGPNMTGLVVPRLSDIELRDDDIIFTRGGFRSWHDYLVDTQNKGRWTWLYAANTGRQRWPFWDIIFEDLLCIDRKDTRGRTWLEYRKPIPDIFKPMDEPLTYDLMIGASNIHNKKGQYKVVEALPHFKRLYGYNLKCVLPGALRRCTGTQRLFQTLDQNSLDVNMASMVPRPELAKLMNRSKIFIHAGAGGQNDRGPLEAMRCGCQIMIASPPHHAPTVYENKEISHVISEPDNPEALARQIKAMINSYTDAKRQQVFEYFEKVNGLETVILPRFVQLFDFFKRHPRQDRAALYKEFGLSETT